MKALKIIAIVLFLLILGFFGVQVWLGNKIKSVIEEKGAELDGGIYDVTVDRATVNIFGRSATLKGVRMMPNRQREAGEGRSDMLYDISIDGVYASGLNMKLLKEGSGAQLRSIEIDRPLITADIYKPDDDRKEVTDSASAKKPLNIPVRRVIIRNGNIIVRQHHDGEASYTEADAIDIDVSLRRRNLSDSLSVRETVDARLSVGSVLMTNRDGSVDTRIDSVRYDSGEGLLTIASVSVDPKYPMAQFVYKSEKHTDWTELRAAGIRCDGLDALLMDGSPYIKADSIYIASGHVESYKDRNANVPYRYKKLLYESVQELPFMVRTDKIVVANMDAVYRELPQYGTEPGVINFTNLSGTFTGLTNIPSAEEPFYTLSAHAAMYGRAPLNATFYFPKTPGTNRFEVHGSLGTMDMTLLNQTIIPLAKAEIEEGTIDKLDFHITGNSSTASVDLTMLYHDLKIALVKNKGDHEIKERRFLSWIANEFVVKDSNPDHGETRRGTGTAERDPDRSQFNFLWRTLLQGIKETAGL
ncbi:MAG: hypothetical protein LUD76_09815 [Alistipes sp.]|nr:hypothetical protein [Alistipes sp.]